MNQSAAAFVLAALARPAWAAEFSLDQQLIIACYNVEVDAVVTCLRKGADVNARFGELPDDEDPLFGRDRWTGGYLGLGANAWTPLLALAAARKYPQPPSELGQIWKDEKRAQALQKLIPEDEIDKRRNDAMIIRRVLLSHGCRLDNADIRGATALYMAAYAKKLAMARTLLQFGANPNTKTQVYIDGPADTTPLHMASPSRELMQLLLDHGADASAKDSDGHTPADWLALYADRTFDLVETPNGWRIQRRNQAPE